MSLTLRTLLLTGVLLAAYQAFLNLARPQAGQTLTFTQGNIIRAQRFLYGFQAQPVVVLGSSLTVPLESHLRQTSVAPLGLVGLGVYDGLEILERTGRAPRLLLLEINHLERRPRREFLDSILKSPMYEVRSYSSAFRHEYQPANLLIPWLESGGSDALPSASPMVLRSQPPEPAQPPQSTDQDRENDVKQALLALPELRDRLESWRSRGVKVAFYELPEHPQTSDSAARESLRRSLLREFPDPRFHWIPLDRGTTYYTVDGQHLHDYDAYMYARYLLEKISLLDPGPIRLLAAPSP